MNCKFRYFSRFRCVGRRSVAGFSVFLRNGFARNRKSVTFVPLSAGFGPVCKDGAAEGGRYGELRCRTFFRAE